MKLFIIFSKISTVWVIFPNVFTCTLFFLLSVFGQSTQIFERVQILMQRNEGLLRRIVGAIKVKSRFLLSLLFFKLREIAVIVYASGNYTVKNKLLCNMMIGKLLQFWHLWVGERASMAGPVLEWSTVESRKGQCVAVDLAGW